MAGQPEIKNMALFCDFENLALGVRDAKYAQFDMQKVLERLLLKGSIIVKKAYCDWERYKAFCANLPKPEPEPSAPPEPIPGVDLLVREVVLHHYLFAK